MRKMMHVKSRFYEASDCYNVYLKDPIVEGLRVVKREPFLMKGFYLFHVLLSKLSEVYICKVNFISIFFQEIVNTRSYFILLCFFLWPCIRHYLYPLAKIYLS